MVQVRTESDSREAKMRMAASAFGLNYENGIIKTTGWKPGVVARLDKGALDDDGVFRIMMYAHGLPKTVIDLASYVESELDAKIDIVFKDDHPASEVFLPPLRLGD